MGIHKITKILNLKNLRSTQVSPNLRIPQGVQAFTTVFLGLLTSFGIGFLINNSAYAASYINVSSGSGGTISFDSIKPSSAGVSASASDTLTITTNCSAGYKVYVSGQENGDTNLTNSSASSNNTISASSTAVGSTATALSSNTWGITGDSANALANKYVGLPAYANATDAALITVPSANTSGNNTNTIYYGVKVDTTLTPGTYSGDVLYTTLVTEACNNYTVHFDANGGTGEMADQTIPVGTATPLTANAFSRSGYAFLGWSTDKNATGQTYLDGQSVKDISDFHTTITLYAVWAASSGTMQSWTGCPSLAEKQSVFLTDTRDNKVYAVKKLPDGKCWMMQNLAIGMDGAKTLTPDNTNIDNGTTYYLPPAGKQGSSTINNSSTLTSSTAANFNGTAHARTQFRTKGSSYSTTAKGYVNDSDTGYYDFYTATLGFSYYNDGKTVGTSSRDICPAGWRLPKVSATATTTSGSRDFTGDFAVLASSYNSGASWTNGTTANRYTTDSTIWDGMMTLSASPLATTTQNNYAGFSYSGNWDSTNSSASNVGSYGRYWSSSISNTDSGYYLSFNSSNIYPQTYYFKDDGYAVRCVAQNNYTINYSNSGTDGGEASKTSESAYESGSVTMPTVGSMTKSGYEFKGWALTSGATDATYTAEQTVTISALITAASTAGQATTPGSTITLYPVWAQSIVYMQDVSASDLTESATTTLRDSRDNQDYTVYRWPSSGTAGTDYPTGMAGYAIMTKDLSLGYVTGGSVTAGSNLSLTTAASNFDSNTSESTGSDKETVTYESTETVKYVNSADGGTGWTTTNSYTNKQYTNGPKSGSETYSSHTYYSWGAAMVACPKGWRLPTDTEYNNIATFMGGDNSTGSSKIRGTPYNFVFGGNFDSSGWHNVGVGGFGYYWSSTQYSSTIGRTLYFYSSTLGAYNLNKTYGLPVRCVAEPPAEDCSETVHPTTTTGCKMKDDNIWIYGNNGNATSWATSYTCPTGYSSPSKETFGSLISAQGSGPQLYSALGLSDHRYFWSTTQLSANNSYYLHVDKSGSNVNNGNRYTGLYVLCYKSAS